MASHEAWTEQREAHLQQLEKEDEALSLVIQAERRTDGRLMKAFADVVLGALQQLSLALNGIPEKHAASTRASIVSTASFAFKNFADGCKSIGLVSFNKNLDQLGKEDNGRWNPQFAHQLNVTVQNIVEKAKEAGVAIPVDMQSPGPPAAEKPDTLPTQG